MVRNKKSLALSGRSPPTTPYNQFHAIAAFTPKPPEEPVCCIKPLAPLEPVVNDLFLSLEDIKAKCLSESSHSHENNAPPSLGAESSAEPAIHHGHFPFPLFCGCY